MPQADGTSALKRMTIKDPHTDAIFNFAINPQEYSVTRPQRVTAIKTMSDIVIEDFNNDIPVLRVSGHTGWQGGKGKQRFDKLEKMLIEYTTRTENLGAITNDPLFFYNYTDDRYYRVHVAQEGFEFKRSSENPLLYQYTLNFYIVSDTATYSNPKYEDLTDKEITTGDTNSTKGDNYKEPESSNTPSIKPVSNPVSSKKVSTKSITETVTVNNKGTVTADSNSPQAVDAITGYATGSLLSSTGVGSTRLGNTLGVVR
jgi:hypothetical protein